MANHASIGWTGAEDGHASVQQLAGVAIISCKATVALACGLLASGLAAQPIDRPRATATPIEHLIVVVGENISFDNLFATYEPPPGETVANLLSRGIVDRDGNPGPHFADAAQREANVRERYQVIPASSGTLPALPRPGTTSARGLPRNVPDARFPSELPNGPFRITRYVAFSAPVGDPVHRFFQMWQQVDGGRNDLFAWVALTSGQGANRRDDPQAGTNQGGVAMGFYSMASGDAAYFRQLARDYAIADNYHQPVMGGTGANFLALSTGHVGAYVIAGKPATPPRNQIEDPDPRTGTNNWYKESGYRGGSYTACADESQPGVKAIRDYLGTLPYKTFNDGNCAPDTYYLVNNYDPGYAFDGTPQQLGPQKFVLPPQTTPNIGTALSAAKVSWKWYSGGRTASGVDRDRYCSICDPLTHSTAVMTGASRANLQDLNAFFRDLGDDKTLPSVSFVIPPNPESGHPASSTLYAFERFVEDLVKRVQANPAVWSKTAILVTTDEGGGYYDSGYIQILDLFGDGTRVPLFAVSPFAKKGHVDHTYYDHVSVLKFIERNWRLSPLSERSRDNLPNPEMRDNPYIPSNRPAIGDLMDLFKF